MVQEPTLYERVWREPTPQGAASKRLPTRGDEAVGCFSAPGPTGHGRTMSPENSITELIDQLETWEMQRPVWANQMEVRILGALETLEARVAHLQRICEGQGAYSPHREESPQQLSNLSAQLTDQVSRMHSDIERRLELQQVDLAKRMEELEASMRRRDMTFIESLVTVAELSWVRPDQASLETSAPPD
jgi:hypothetical protein